MISGDSAMTSCNDWKCINGGEREMQQRFFSRTLVLIRGDFHKEVVTDNASVPPNLKPIVQYKDTHAEYFTEPPRKGQTPR